MKLTAKVKLLPNPAQRESLLKTVRKANAACNFISNVAWRTKTFPKFPLQKIVYHDARDRFSLVAQLTIRCIAKVSDSYKSSKGKKTVFRDVGAINYDCRILRWYEQEVSIWTVDGRQRIPFVCGPRHRELLRSQRGESHLCLIDGQFYLFTACDIETPDPAAITDYLGVDLGIRNIAVDSDGNKHAGGHLNSLRRRHDRLRTRLQRKGTKAARRLLKRRRRKEQRMAKDINHGIAKDLVRLAQGTGRGIALEMLKGIRDRVTVRRSQRRTHHSWAFDDLREKIVYKAALAGVLVCFVDPRKTSQECPKCGHADRKNRKTQEHFRCVSCGYSANADCNAACNIARRALVNVPNAGGLISTPPASRELCARGG